MLWQLEGNNLLVSDGALFPKVDFETGTTGKDLIARRTRHLRRTTFYQLVNTALFVTFLVSSEEPLRCLGAWLATVLLWLLPRIPFSYLPAAIGTVITFTVHQEKRAWEKSIRLKKIRSITAILTTLGPVVVILLQAGSVMKLAIAAVVILVMGFLTMRLVPRRFFVTDGPGEWFVIGGLHPAALRFLSEEKARS